MCIDLIVGPYKIRRKGQDDLICRCVTMIDPATGWFEIHEYDDKRSLTVANIAEQEWFCRYPWPTQVTFDRGSEFIRKDFQKMIGSCNSITRLVFECPFLPPTHFIPRISFCIFWWEPSIFLNLSFIFLASRTSLYIFCDL